MEKKISIIIRAYNSEKTIKRALESALGQKYPKKNFEIIAVNDGSGDKTRGILEQYKEKIKIVNQKNKGAVPSANKGFKTAQGKYVITLDSDDYFEKNLLKEMADVLDKNPKINFVYCNYYEKSKLGKIKKIPVKNIFQTLACTTMYRKSDLAKAGFWKNIKFPEYEILLKTLGKWHGYHIKKALYHFNRNKESLSGKKQWVREAIGELKKLHPDKAEEIKKIRKFR